jgi:hypothetical protein
MVANAHVRAQQRLRAICYRDFVSLHTGVYYIPDSVELPAGSWTIAYAPRVFSNGSSLILFVAGQDSSPSTTSLPSRHGHMRIR